MIILHHAFIRHLFPLAYSMRGLRIRSRHAAYSARFHAGGANTTCELKEKTCHSRYKRKLASDKAPMVATFAAYYPGWNTNAVLVVIKWRLGRYESGQIPGPSWCLLSVPIHSPHFSRGDSDPMILHSLSHRYSLHWITQHMNHKSSAWSCRIRKA